MTSRVAKLALAAALAIGTIAPAVAQAQSPVIIRMTTMSPGGARNYSLWFKPWADRINAASHGAVKVEVVEGFSVANLNNIYDRLMADIVQIGWVIHPLIGGKFPLTEVAGLPFLANSSPELSVALWRLYKSGALDKEYDDMMPLGLNVFSQSNLHYAKKPQSLDNLNGLKVSSSSRVQTQLIGQLGGAAVNMPPSDFYQSLMRSVVDATMTSWAAFAPFKLQEVTTFHVEAPFGASTNGFLMARKKYASLPEAGRKAIDANSGEALTLQFGKFMDGEAAFIRGPIAKDTKHHTIVHLSPEQEKFWAGKAKLVVDEWAASMPARGPVLAKFRELLAQVQAGK
jgi:TRAP-type C4-dicarboxylate transport system substrate-binding protein